MQTDHASPPETPTRGKMTPIEAHDLFLLTCLRISDSGIDIKGLDVNRIEFHDAAHRAPPAKLDVDGPYRCELMTDVVGQAQFEIRHVEESRPIGVVRDGVVAQRIVDTLNSAHAKLASIKANLEAIQHDERVVLQPGAVPPNSTGDVCAKCGSHNLTWSGTCKTCRDCGDAGGCG